MRAQVLMLILGIYGDKSHGCITAPNKNKLGIPQSHPTHLLTLLVSDTSKRYDSSHSTFQWRVKGIIVFARNKRSWNLNPARILLITLNLTRCAYRSSKEPPSKLWRSLWELQSLLFEQTRFFKDSFFLNRNCLKHFKLYKYKNQQALWHCAEDHILTHFPIGFKITAKSTQRPKRCLP